jgi:arginase family enzyme
VPIPESPLYISIDLDALDPAFAPGVSHHEPGGLSVRDVISVLHRVPPPIVGADVVEFNPSRDLNGMTAVVAAKFVKELAALAAKGA